MNRFNILYSGKLWQNELILVKKVLAKSHVTFHCTLALANDGQNNTFELLTNLNWFFRRCSYLKCKSAFIGHASMIFKSMWKVYLFLNGYEKHALGQKCGPISLDDLCMIEPVGSRKQKLVFSQNR